MFGGTPEPALLAGLFGVIPYAAASIATLLLTWDINAATHGSQALKGTTASSGTTPNCPCRCLWVNSILSRPSHSTAFIGCLTTHPSRLWSCSSLLPRRNPLGTRIRWNGRPSRTHPTPSFHPSLTKGIPSILSRNSCSNISLANNPSPHKLRLDRTIPRLHRNVLR